MSDFVQTQQTAQAPDPGELAWNLEESNKTDTTCRRFQKVAVGNRSRVNDVWVSATSIESVAKLPKNTRVMMLDTHQTGDGTS